MDRELTIKPYIGVDDLRFGIKPSDVVKIIGSSVDIDKNFFGERTEDREPGILITYSKPDNLLVEFGFGRRVLGLKYNNMALFKEPPERILMSLIKDDGSPYERFGFIILLNLGITLTGFHDKDEDQRAVTVFSRGRWDVMKDNLKPFKYKNFI